tara:strand:- start:1571 stop:1981 length:411 start_codon:yes stop_codon:yes gene_type:complete
MTSVNDVQLQENYICIDGMTAELRPHVKVYPHKRDWSRTAYETDLRYIESVMWGACAMMPEHVSKMVVSVDCAKISVFLHYAPTFYERLILNVRQKFKNRIYEIRIINASLSTKLLFWMYQNEFPYGLHSKIKWVI